MNICSRILSCHRIAPVQFTAWGHPITTGSPNIDYFLSSDLMEPENAQSHYSETLVRLPNLALFLTAPPARPSQAGVFAFPEGRVLYGCLQSLPKYLPQYDVLLPMIAKAVPQALFVFLEGTPVYATAILKERLFKAFTSQGLDFNRYVMFLPPVSPDGYIDLLSQMDVILDSIGWTGGNTSLQAIELGKPIVTLPGEFMRGRHTLAMFKMMGLEKQVATSIDDYISKAVRLGSDGELRSQLGAEILKNKHLLYEDHVFIDAFDAFLKREFARQGA
jgi:predicted O-linked N-acetylglucosamine transferase (SPINDLY family)